MAKRSSKIFSLAALLTLSSSNYLHGFTRPQLVSLLVFDHISNPSNNPLSFMQRKLGLAPTNPISQLIDASLGNRELDDLPAVHPQGVTGHTVTIIDRLGKAIALSASTKATMYTLAYLLKGHALFSDALKTTANYIAGFDEETTKRVLGLDHDKDAAFDEEEACCPYK